VAVQPRASASVESSDETSGAGAERHLRASPERASAVLVVGTDDWAIEQLGASLSGARHAVLRCHEPGEPTFPCNAFIPGRTCPIDAGVDVVVTVRARPRHEPAPGEMGVVCAVRAGAPLVVAGMTHDNPFAQLAPRIVEPGGDVASVCADVIDRVVDLTGR
jgi:hypothetical protein